MALHKSLNAETVRRVEEFVTKGVEAEGTPIQAASDPFWKSLRETGTELWLDTGDMEVASALWCKEFTALTTNNTLLNKEVQKGIYDDLIAEAGDLLTEVAPQTRVIEIGFILNARHGLRLARHFGARVSVELHTDLAHDIEATLFYARRYQRICPTHFIIKVPLTPSGLIATRRLRNEGMPINFTLGFSARHNYLAAAFARPSYVNVFLGRINSYVESHKLGDGRMAGEKATLASQRAIREFDRTGREPVKQIAASMRDASQVASLAGMDVFTMPTAVAEAAKKQPSGKWESHVADDYTVTFNPGVDLKEVRPETLWGISDPVRELAQSLSADVPETADALVARAHELGAGDLFPRLSENDLARIASDGKIPKHEAWKARIRSGELAVDTLLNLAGLASFATDQKALDDRIRAHGL